MNRTIWFIITIFLLESCSTSKKASVKIVDYNKSELIESIIERNKTIKNLVINYTATIEDGDVHNSVVGQIRIIKDQMVWINVNAKIGLELARALFTKDSIQIMIPSQKILYHSGYDITQKYFDNSLKLSSIQYGLTGSLFTIGTEFLKRQMNIETDDSMDVVFYERSKNFITNLKIDSSTLKPKKIKVNKVSEPLSVEIQYKNFIMINDLLLPQVIEILFIEKEKSKRVLIQYKKITESDDINIHFKVPNRYKRVSL